MEFIVIIVLIVVAWFAISIHLDKKRREKLLAKYGDAEIVDRILKKCFGKAKPLHNY